jgi:hypothetical protein
MKIKTFGLFAISAAICCLLTGGLTVTANSQMPTVTYSSSKYQAKVPDWSRLTWSSLPPVQQPGYLSVPPEIATKFGYNPSRSWSAGQNVDSIVMLGDVEDAFKLSVLSLKSIGAIVPLGLKLTLKDLGLMQWQTPATLVKAIPELGNLNISQVQPIQDLFAQAGMVGGGKLSQVIQLNPRAANLPLGKLDLSRYSINSIPGLTQTQIGRFQGWQQSLIGQVPGLNKVPFAQMPQPISSGTDVVGIASIVLGQAEHGDPRVGDKYFISGRVVKGDRTIPVACPTGKECSYMELGDFAGFNGSLYGKRWVSGESQQVKGGFGILAKVNGGKEPTGRLVFGNAFKVVLTGVNESKGTADFGLFFRICANIPFSGKTCTPYFIGPVPWIPVRENDLVIVGSG